MPLLAGSVGGGGGGGEERLQILKTFSVPFLPANFQLFINFQIVLGIGSIPAGHYPQPYLTYFVFKRVKESSIGSAVIEISSYRQKKT